MKIYIGADHRGFHLKKKIVFFLAKQGFSVVDMGTHEEGKSCDYPLISHDVAKAVASTKEGRGILVCMTGIGNAIAANKVPGVRAALCYNKKAAFLSRTHNDSNVLVLGAKFVKSKELLQIVTIWLTSSFEGGRHLRRVNQIRAIERRYSNSKRKT
jgi:ribose 5-phosphate isomerase B